MHARASARFASLASQFDCDVFLYRDELEVNGKSIMGLMMLAAAQGCEICIRTKGANELEALQALSDLVSQRFGEDA